VPDIGLVPHPENRKRTWNGPETDLERTSGARHQEGTCQPAASLRRLEFFLSGDLR
jgi:hypothetical protein